MAVVAHEPELGGLEQHTFITSSPGGQSQSRKQSLRVGGAWRRRSPAFWGFPSCGMETLYLVLDYSLPIQGLKLGKHPLAMVA